MAIPVSADRDHQGVSRILNLPAPVADDEPARKVDIDSALRGLGWKDNAVAATTGNIDLASPGSTMDGVTLVNGDRILVKDQTADAENGIYIWNGAASPATRADDGSTANSLENAIVTIDEGTANVGTTWRQTAVNFTLDTDPIAFTSFGDTTPLASETVAGRVELATQGEVDTGTAADLALTPATAKGSAWRGRGKSSIIGDGTATQYDVTHNWSTRNIHVRVVQNSGSYIEVEAEISKPDTNTVRVNFSSAIASNSHVVLLREVPTA